MSERSEAWAKVAAGFQSEVASLIKAGRLHKALDLIFVEVAARSIVDIDRLEARVAALEAPKPRQRVKAPSRQA